MMLWPILIRSIANTQSRFNFNILEKIMSAQGHEKIISYNPTNSEVLGEVEVSSLDEVKSKVLSARSAQKEWAVLGVEKRIQHIKKLIPLFEKNKEAFVRRTSEEMGMAHSLSKSIVDSAISDLQWNCDHAAKYLANDVVFDDGNEINEIVYEPYGVIACIVAWNFPLANFVISASQALLAGNSVVMKYSEEIVLFSKFLEEIIAEAGLPEGVVNFVYGDGTTGQMLFEQDIDFISFTGSSATGRKLYKKAAEKFIPIALELGGSSPAIVFEDCVLDEAFMEQLFWARFSNTGQFCDNLKRLIVHQNIFDECVEKLSSFAKSKTIGDPLNPDIDLGPLVAERQAVKVEEQVKDALAKGAILHCGGKRPAELNGAFYEPTILTNITPDMAVWNEEVFGPALPVVSFDTYEEAIKLANDTEYGLTGYVFTNDKDILQKAFTDIKAGGVSANQNHFYRPENPFGGYKASGLGRQGGKIGFHEVCQIKTVARSK